MHCLPACLWIPSFSAAPDSILLHFDSMSRIVRPPFAPRARARFLAPDEDDGPAAQGHSQMWNGPAMKEARQAIDVPLSDRVRPSFVRIRRYIISNRSGFRCRDSGEREGPSQIHLFSFPKSPFLTSVHAFLPT